MPVFTTNTIIISREYLSTNRIVFPCMLTFKVALVGLLFKLDKFPFMRATVINIYIYILIFAHINLHTYCLIKGNITAYIHYHLFVVSILLA